MNEFVLNAHNKEEHPQSHTAEHLLNQTMIRMFGCGRSGNAHIERKTSTQISRTVSSVMKTVDKCLHGISFLLWDSIR